LGSVYSFDLTVALPEVLMNFFKAMVDVANFCFFAPK